MASKGACRWVLLCLLLLPRHSERRCHGEAAKAPAAELAPGRKLSGTSAPARGAGTKSKATARSSQAPWAQPAAAEWEGKAGPSKAAALAELQEFFIKKQAAIMRASKA